MMPLKHSRRLLLTSHLSFLLFVVVIALEIATELAVCDLLVGLTSVNHWRDPRLGWRRNADIVAVFFTVATHVRFAVVSRAFFAPAYVVGVAVAATVYLKAKHIGKRDTNASSLLHCFIHAFGFVMNVVLYTHPNSSTYPNSMR